MRSPGNFPNAARQNVWLHFGLSTPEMLATSLRLSGDGSLRVARSAMHLIARHNKHLEDGKKPGELVRSADYDEIQLRCVIEGLDVSQTQRFRWISLHILSGVQVEPGRKPF